ncbi:MerR family transcriptional regulator [Agrilactobacillus yilanensis]|uniref:MerR family transcriptional regulator n=1 Tax=Agrilactobacillus yilanensis TaxID=2485997 RepID=A0ABW4J677_9LACO|nr:MerR family transcriptional regulator [Agrilactobacillus yilanensis]
MSVLSIQEVSQKYAIKTDTIRYYERIGLMPPVPRKANGNRYFDEALQGWLEMLVCLRRSGISIEALHDYTEMVQAGDKTLMARQNLLEAQRTLLLEKQADLERSLKRLDHKISLYKSGEIRANKSYFEEYKIPETIQLENERKRQFKEKGSL